MSCFENILNNSLKSKCEEIVNVRLSIKIDKLY